MRGKSSNRRTIAPPEGYRSEMRKNDGGRIVGQSYSQVLNKKAEQKVVQIFHIPEPVTHRLDPEIFGNDVPLLYIPNSEKELAEMDDLPMIYCTIISPLLPAITTELRRIVGEKYNLVAIPQFTCEYVPQSRPNLWPDGTHESQSWSDESRGGAPIYTIRLAGRKGLSDWDWIDCYISERDVRNTIRTEKYDLFRDSSAVKSIESGGTIGVPAGPLYYLGLMINRYLALNRSERMAIIRGAVKPPGS